MDLKFPHHENEIAQTCAACGSKFVNVWMHNGFVRVDDEKMSKSLGNFFTVREVLEWVRDPEVVRYFMLGSHYRGPINYTPDSLAQADAALERLYLALRGVTPPRRAPRRLRPPRDSPRRWTTTSTRRWRWRSCSRSRASSIPRKAAGQPDVAAARRRRIARARSAPRRCCGLDPETFLRKRPLKHAGPSEGESAAPRRATGR